MKTTLCNTKRLILDWAKKCQQRNNTLIGASTFFDKDTQDVWKVLKKLRKHFNKSRRKFGLGKKTFLKVEQLIPRAFPKWGIISA